MELVEVEEMLEGLYSQKEEIEVSESMHKLLMLSGQVVVKTSGLDLGEDEVKLEPKVVQSDDDNGLFDDQSFFEDVNLEDSSLAPELNNLKEEPLREEAKKRRRGRPRKNLEPESSEDDWEEYCEKTPPKKRRTKTPKKKKIIDDDVDYEEEDDEEEEEDEGRRISKRCSKCCRRIAGHPLPRHIK